MLKKIVSCFIIVFLLFLNLTMFSGAHDDTMRPYNLYIPSHFWLDKMDINSTTFDYDFNYNGLIVNNSQIVGILNTIPSTQTYRLVLEVSNLNRSDYSYKLFVYDKNIFPLVYARVYADSETCQIEAANPISCHKYVVLGNGTFIDLGIIIAGESGSGIQTNWTYPSFTGGTCSKIIMSGHDIYNTDNLKVFDSILQHWICFDYLHPVFIFDRSQYSASIISPRDGFTQSQINNIECNVHFKVPRDMENNETEFGLYPAMFGLTVGNYTVSKSEYNDCGDYWDVYLTYSLTLPWDVATPLHFDIYDYLGNLYTDSATYTCWQGFIDSDNDGLDDRSGEDFFERSIVNFGASTNQGSIFLNEDGTLNITKLQNAFDLIKSSFTILPIEIQYVLGAIVISILAVSVIKLIH